MIDIYKLKEELQDIQKIVELAEVANILEEAEQMSAFEVCEWYIATHNLEYIAPEIRQAFKYGFMTCISQKDIQS